MNRVLNYMRENAVRVYAIAVAVMALVAHYMPNLPGDLILGVVAAAVALLAGEKVQRVEDRKSANAFWQGRAK